MTTKHTPGPWTMRPWKNSRAVTITTDANNVRKDICNIISFLPEVKANACLIAAAPDLLEALELALHVRGTSEDTPAVRDKMATTLAKAKGE